MASLFHSPLSGTIRSLGASLIIGMALLTTSCQQETTPRPEGYFRIDAYPARHSQVEMGDITILVNDSAQCVVPASHRNNDKAHWLNIVYPRYNATIHLSYFTLQDNLERLMGESIELVYRQNVNTEMVEAYDYEAPEAQLYATLFALSPESATPLQFIATDSVSYLLRGALYFDTPVKADSVAPSLQYLEEDIMLLIENITHTQE